MIYDWTRQMARELAPILHPDQDVESVANRMTLEYQSWNVWEDWGVTPGLFSWAWEKSIKRGDMYTNGGVMPGAVEALWTLSDHEWHVHICTSRLNKFRLHDQAVVNTAVWLAEHGIPYRSLTFTEDKSVIHVDAIVDDKPSNVETSPAIHKLLFPAPHNDNVLPLREDVVKLRTQDPWAHLLEILL